MRSPWKMQAATIARATGTDNVRVKDTSRLGSQSSRAEANTWKTFATAFMNRDGSGYISVRRNNKTYTWNFGPEDAELPRFHTSSDRQRELEINAREGLRQDILAGYIDNGLNEGDK